MIWLFYILVHYLFIWFVIFMSVKLDNSNRYSYDLVEKLKTEQIWLLIMPILGVFSSLVYFIIVTKKYIKYKYNFDSGKIIEFIFGGDPNKRR